MSARDGPDPWRVRMRRLGGRIPKPAGRRDNGAGPPGADGTPEADTAPEADRAPGAYGAPGADRLPGAKEAPDAGRPIRVLYIAGIGRSGSTLLNRSLGATPGFFAGGELMHFFGRGVCSNELCACGSPFRECEVWGDVIRELGPVATPDRAAAVDPFRHAITEGKHLPTMLLSPWKPSSLRRRLEEYKETVVEVYRAVRRVTGCQVLVDSSKNLSYARILQSVPELRIFVVHLVRDPRGVTFSMSKTIRRPGVPWSEEYLSRRGPAAGSVLWMAANLAAESLRSRADGYVRIRYTDFVGSPADTLRRILRMTGEEEDAGRLAHLEGRTLRLGVQHILSGNPVRGRTGEIPLQEDLEWESEMAPGRRRLVTTVTLPFLLRYGYLSPDGRRDGAAAPAGPEDLVPGEGPSPAPAVGRGAPVGAPPDGAG